MKNFQILLTGRKYRGEDMLDIKCLDNWKDFIFAGRHEQIQNFLIQLSSFQSSLLSNQHENQIYYKDILQDQTKK